jgi:hypothetical protein
MEQFETRIPVPKIFWSFETGRPMDRCRMCDCDLMENSTDYLIEKAFCNGETLFEVALCLDCHTKCAAELSKESTENIQRYFETRINIEDRFFNNSKKFGTQHEHWISHCMIKGYPIEECTEHQIYGYCSGSDLLFSGAPYMLSGESIEEIVDQLSSKTLDALGALSDQLLGLDMPQNIILL